tara:strand:- start:226 stop:486 length:261 start_codon:yes stop_codon:yes gene_type:complete
MATITTKFLGPTTYRGARVKAACQAGTVTLSWDYALNQDGNHCTAAIALSKKVDWYKSCPNMIGGWTDTGCVFVFIPHSVSQALAA